MSTFAPSADRPAIAHSAAESRNWLRRLNPTAVSIWVLVLALVLYLGINGGGYDPIVRSDAGIVVWWIILLGATAGVLPAARPSRTALVALTLLCAFGLWTGLASTWSLSTERSLNELSRVACYLGILLLALAIHRDRREAIRHTLGALAVAIAVLAVLSLASRLFPGLFPQAHEMQVFLAGNGRLSWPLNYWNALAALLAMGVPLLVAIASTSRPLGAQAGAAAMLPILTLCGYLTLSRGGALAAGSAIVTFLILAPDRVPKLMTTLFAAAGSAILVAEASTLRAVQQGLDTPAARHQGVTLLMFTIAVCTGVGLAQIGVGIFARRRHGSPARRLSRRASGLAWTTAAVVAVATAVALGAPGVVSHAWQDFKHPAPLILDQNSLGRYASVSGNGRYDYWSAAVHATTPHDLLTGSGPGTFQFLWLPRAAYYNYVQNAHSLYVETFSDLGLVGLLLLIGFLGVIVVAAIMHVIRSVSRQRTLAAGVAAAMIAFCVSAAFDWIWQVPVLPAAFILLGAAVLAPRARGHWPRRWPLRLGAVGLSIASLVAIVIPLTTTANVRTSQAAAASGHYATALAAARTAARIEPGAASPRIQAALVLEVEGDTRQALAEARQASADEPDNWSTWLIVSRLEAERGNPRAALKAFRRARALNPRSPLFRSR